VLTRRSETPPSAFPPGGEALLDLVDPQHGRRHGLGGAQGRLEALLGLPDVLAVDAGRIEQQQGTPPSGGQRLGHQRLAAAGHAGEQDPAGGVEPYLVGALGADGAAPQF